MSKLSDSVSKFKVHFHTNGNVPPPYCYQIDMDISLNVNDIDVIFEMRYTNREELTAEDLEMEGFTPNDDYIWQGKIDIAWSYDLIKLLDQTKIFNEKQLREIYLVADSQEYLPMIEDQAMAIFQNIVQAVFETSGKEREWSLWVCKGDQINASKCFNIFFKNKTATDFVGVQVGWPKAIDIMKMIYLCDFIDEKANAKISNEDNYRISFDEEYWYELGVGFKNPHKNFSNLNQIKALFDTYFL